MKRFIRGFKIYFSGMRLWISHKSLLRLSIIPFCLDLLCLVFGLYFTITRIPTLVAKLVHAPEVWYQYVLYYLVLIVTALSLFFVVIFIVFIFANLLAFPFNDLLAEKTLRLQGALPESLRIQGRLRSWVQKSTRNLGAMTKKSVIFLAIGGLMTVTTLIPGLGLLGAFAGMFLLAFDRLDYAFDHYQLPFNKRLAFVRKHLPEMIGFAGALGLTTTIPVINILIMPGSVVAGASLVAHFIKEESKS